MLSSYVLLNSTSIAAMCALVAAAIVLINPTATTAVEFKFPMMVNARIVSVKERQEELSALLALSVSQFSLYILLLNIYTCLLILGH